MIHAAPAHLAAVLGALSAPLVLGARRRWELVAGLALVAAAEGALVDANTGGGRVSTLAAAAVGALVVAGGGGYVLLRRPALVPPLVLLAAPFRLPLDFNRHHRFYVAVAQGGELGRLLPLYVVLLAAAGALALRTLRGDVGRTLPPAIAWPTGAFLAFASLSLLWTEDLPAGADRLEFFLLPFTLLVAVVARSPFPAWMPRALAYVGVGVGCALAAIGLWEEQTHRLLFFAPKIQISNAYASFFRVTSLFRDPSLYGRHVVLAMTVVIAALWLRRTNVVLAALVLAFLWFGLYFSYSQSSFAALFVVVLAAAAIAGGRRARLAVAAGVVATALAVAGVGAAELTHHSARQATSDRSRRATMTLHAWEHRPIAGVGLGAQPLATQRLATKYARTPHFVSHTTPLTVLAELGVVGLALYVALLAGAGRTLRELHRRDAILGLTLALALLALFVHSLFYSGFFEDPLTWFVLGAAAAALHAPREEAERVPVRPAREPVLTG